MANQSLSQPIEEFERQMLSDGSRLGGGDAIALYEMPETIQEAFAAGFNRRSEIAELLAEEQKARVAAVATPEDIKSVKRVSATGPKLIQVSQALDGEPDESDPAEPSERPAG